MLAASAAVAAGAFALTPGAQAATYQVNSLADGPITACDATCTLRDAIGSSNNDGINDVITFQSSLSGTIRLTNGSLHPIGAESVEIRGPGGGQVVVSGDTNLSGVADSGDTRPFIITATTEMSGLTVEDGYAANGPGGAIWSVGMLTLRDMDIRDSRAGNIGASTPTKGGGLAAEGSSTLVTGSTFDSNYGISGGGIWATRKLTLRDSTLVGNEAYNGGGGLAVDGTYAQAEVTNTVASGNTADYGAGIDFFVPAPVLGPSDPSIDSVVTRSTISGNDAVQDGAGIRIGNLGSNGEVRVEQSTISGNDAGSGAGIATNGGSPVNKVRIVNSTISENDATSVGGGASIHKAADVDFENSTITANTAGLQGGGIRLGTYPAPEPPNNPRTPWVGLTSTIVGFNFVGGNPNDLQQAPGADGGGFQTAFNLIQAPGTSSIVPTAEGTDQLGVEPGLGILTDNGGPTLTHAPLPGSPAIDAGYSPGLGVDQIGRPRTVDRSPANRSDGTDIGAVELPLDPVAPVPAEAPNTKITKRPAATIDSKGAKKVVRVTFVANVEGSRFECKVNGGPFTPCRSPARLNLAAGPGKGRFHLIQVRAIGPTGLVETQPARFGVRIRRTRK